MATSTAQACQQQHTETSQQHPFAQKIQHHSPAGMLLPNKVHRTCPQGAEPVWESHLRWLLLCKAAQVLL